MTSSASPYAVFQAEDWSPSVASPIGIGQCLRIQPKKCYRRNGIRRRAIGIPWRRFPQKVTFGLLLHDMPILQLFLWQALSYASRSQCETTARASNFTMSALGAATRERN